MELTRKQVKWLGIATHWPPIYMVLFFIIWLISFVGMMGLAGFAGMSDSAGSSGGGPPPEAVEGVAMAGGAVMMALFSVVFLLHALTMIMMLGLAVIYLIHAVTTRHLESNERVLWGLLCVLTGPLGQLVYYYLKLRHMPPADGDGGAVPEPQGS